MPINLFLVQGSSGTVLKVQVCYHDQIVIIIITIFLNFKGFPTFSFDESDHNLLRGSERTLSVLSKTSIGHLC